MTRWWWRLSQWATRLGGSLFWDLRVSGLENIPREGGCLLAANHQSYLDPPFVASVLPREMHFMARRSLFRNPVFRALIVRYNAFAIERDRADVKGVKSAIERLEAGNLGKEEPRKVAVLHRASSLSRRGPGGSGASGAPGSRR